MAYYNGYSSFQDYPSSEDYSSSGASSDQPECEWCGDPTHYWPNGKPKRYCDLQCRMHVSHVNGELCLFCRSGPKWMDPNLSRPRDFCGMACRKKAFEQAPLLLEVDRHSRSFQSVRDQFQNSWRHTDKHRPTLVRLFKVISHSDSHERYIQYRNEVEDEHDFMRQRGRQTAGNERRRFHGTERRCQIGDPRHSVAKFCKSPHCRVCAILRTSFDLTRAGENTDFGRFGRGIYTTATSSKADDYSKDMASPFNAYILTKVVLGNPFVAYYSDQTMAQPPYGYDSVVGEPGGDLNHDEAVVYDEDAVRPSYLLICEP